MTITANYIISEVWELANMDARKTAGKTGSQKRAFRLLLTIRGGVGFIACRPEAELAELGRRGICSAKLGTILRKMAGVELQRRRGSIDVSGFKAQMRILMREAARPGDSVISESGTEESRVPKTRRKRNP